MKRAKIIGLAILAMAMGCAADPSDGEGESSPGEGVFALPDSWERQDLQASPASGAIDKSPGSESRTGVGPTINSKNVLYTLTLPFAAPHAGPLTSVVYNWGLSYKPAGLTVYLCRNTTSTCINITASQSGSTTAFNPQTSNVPFILAFIVSGSGTMSPAFGQTDQVIINHS